ncbi:MAG: hypothetical protein HYU66_16495 [Armatimonadetes bacterium]|nr:hypothetical protein [Armatimonadota bacterium]
MTDGSDGSTTQTYCPPARTRYGGWLATAFVAVVMVAMGCAMGLHRHLERPAAWVLMGYLALMVVLYAYMAWWQTQRASWSLTVTDTGVTRLDAKREVHLDWREVTGLHIRGMPGRATYSLATCDGRALEAPLTLLGAQAEALDPVFWERLTVARERWQSALWEEPWSYSLMRNEFRNLAFTVPVLIGFGFVYNGVLGRYAPEMVKSTPGELALIGLVCELAALGAHRYLGRWGYRLTADTMAETGVRRTLTIPLAEADRVQLVRGVGGADFLTVRRAKDRIQVSWQAPDFRLVLDHVLHAATNAVIEVENRTRKPANWECLLADLPAERIVRVPSRGQPPAS